MRKDILLALAAVLTVAAVAFGLSTLSRDLPITPSEPFQAETAAPAGAAQKPAGSATDKVVMHVNGEPITEREFLAFVEAAPAQARALYASPLGRRALADEVAKLKALEQEGRRLGVDRDPAVKTQIDMMRAQITAGRALEKLIDERSEQKVRAAFEKERNHAIVLRHIAVAYQGGELPARDSKQAPSAAAAMAKAQTIAQQLRGGADFTSLARMESDDTESAGNGGVLGPTKPEMLPSDIAGIVSKLTPGQISEPVKTKYAVHVFKTEPASLEDMRPVLAQQVRQETAQEEIARINKSAKIELDPKFFPERRPGTAGARPPAANPEQ